MLSHHPLLNPAVTRAAELLTDRGLSDALLRDVATMRGLPLLIERAADAGPSALTLAERELASAQAEHDGSWAVLGSQRPDPDLVPRRSDSGGDPLTVRVDGEPQERQSRASQHPRVTARERPHGSKL